VDTLQRRDVLEVLVRGQPASPGIGRGHARFVRTAEEAAAGPEGDVLLVDVLDPTWIPAFHDPAAVVTETGGALSNCATALRERGVPAVVGAAGLAASVHAGDLLEVDGAKGLIARL
jgi:pyruvate,water dikinase